MKSLLPLFLSILTLLTASIQMAAQLNIQPVLTPQLITNTLVSSGITNVTGVTYTGAPGAAGYFSTGSVPTNLGISSGILLTTGLAQNAQGPNTSTAAGTNLGQPGNPLLDSLFPANTTFDAAAITITFTPQDCVIFIRYVFGSEEYPEYVNSNFSDCLGMFLSGPNPQGGDYQNFNIATVPGTNTPIGISTINNGTSNSGPCINCQYYIDNGGGVFVQYDAFTTVLTASAQVVPGMSYTLQIAIADGGDAILDAGVFLEAQSLSSANLSWDIVYNHLGNHQMGYEGCCDVEVTFFRPAPANDTMVIHFGHTFGTATNGVDFPQIPDSLIILPGQHSTTLIISPYADTLTEGPEYFSIVLPVSSYRTDTLTIHINDYTTISVTMPPDTVVPCMSQVQLNVQVTGGVQPFSYQWSPVSALNSHMSATPWTKPLSQSTVFQVTVTDLSGCPGKSGSIGVTFDLIQQHPQDQSVNSGAPVMFCVAPLTWPTSFYWQVDDGSGFVYLNNGPLYSGVWSDCLIITSATAAMNQYRYRCVIETHSCSMSSDVATLHVLIGLDEPDKGLAVLLFPNPAQTMVTLVTPTEMTGGTWRLTDITGRLLLSGIITSTETNIPISGIPAGICILQVQDHTGKMAKTLKLMVE
jgi:hypothetical protein